LHPPPALAAYTPAQIITRTSRPTMNFRRARMNRVLRKAVVAAIAAGAALTAALPAGASSHREAPFITTMPRMDGTDFYIFRSYEAGHEGYVTLIANYLPLQAAYGGPNYFDLESDGIYEIHIDNDGNAVEDLTFRFDFDTVVSDFKVPAGDRQVSIPLINKGAIGPTRTDTSNVNSRQTYTVDLIRSNRRSSNRQTLTSTSGETRFRKPVDNIGTKSIPDYETYARDHIYDIVIPGCGNGRVFVGQRAESFSVNLGPVFDLVNLNPLGAPDAVPNQIGAENITSLALEVPIACLTRSNEPVIGAWTTSSLRQARVLNPFPEFDKGRIASISGGAWSQVSRLSAPLVNELVVGLKDKDRFNASQPKDDSQFATYVTNPTLPELLEILFSGVAVAPNLFPRTDLVAAFLTGVPGLNQPANVKPAEMMRLNTSIAAKPAASQSNLGALGGDTSGFPNGRRPGDDVVDIELRVAMGALIEDSTVAPNNKAPLTDGAPISAADFDESFPYLRSPTPGATAQ
jgi:hypothetical protein